MFDTWRDMPPLDNYEVLAACTNRYRKQLEQLHALYMATTDFAELGALGVRLEALRWRWFYCYGALMMAEHLSRLVGEEP